MDFEISVEETGEVARQINIGIPRSIYNERFNAAVKTASSQARIKGFRPGKVPTHIVTKIYGERIHFEVMGELVSSAYEKAIKDNKLSVVGEPDISFDENEDKNADLSVKANVYVEPTPEIKDYFGVKVSVEEQEASEEVIEDYLLKIRKAHGELLPVEGRTKVKKGDVVTVDYSGSVAGEEIEGLRGMGQNLEIGDNDFIPGFDDELKGKEVGQDYQIEITFPAEYQDDQLAGKTASFQTKITQVQTRKLPDLDDEFAKKTGQAQTVDELKTKIKENLEREAKNRSQQEKEEKVFEAIAEKNTFEIPQPMIDAEIRAMLFRFGALDPKKRESYSFDVSQFRDSFGKSSMPRVRNSIILEQIIKQEDFSVSDEDLEKWLDGLATEHSVAREEVDKQMGYPGQKDRLKSQAARQKMVELLLEKAKIKATKKPLELNQ